MKAIKRFFISFVVTPERVRKVVASVLSWLICKCIATGAWDTLSAATKWLRSIADFIDRWNGTELAVEQDQLVADLVADAVTDEAVGRLIDTVSAMQADLQAQGR